MKTWKSFILLLTLISVLLLSGITSEARTTSTVKFAKSRHISNELLDKMNLKNYDKLMIVAHPDDEILWGGMHLINSNYLVVCLTNAETKQYGKRRANEFKAVMEKTGDRAIIMYYPDKTNGKKDDWSKCSSYISKDIAKLLAYKPWKLVVTHGVKGEYGHLHHKLTNKLVTKAFNSSKLKGSTLYGFGTYYSKKTVLPKSKYTKKQIAAKKKILDLYKSQNTTNLEHMIGYENWTTISTK